MKKEQNDWRYIAGGQQRWRYRENGTVECETVNNEPEMTHQEFKEDCDVNVILDKYMKLGQMPQWNSRTGIYGDFSSMPSYQEAMDTVIKAQDLFMDLPVAIRQRFANDPQQLMDFLSKEENKEEAIKIGLVNPKPVQVDPNQSVVDAIKGLKDIATK